MYGVEAQAVEVKLVEPVERVVDEEVAHDAAVLAVEIDRMPPRSAMARGEELRCVSVQIVADGRERQDAVVTPAAPAAEIADRHQFERGHAQVAQVVELRLDRRERALGGER